MNKFKKIQNQKYYEKTKSMSEEEKKSYDKLLYLQNNFNSMVKELHAKLFSEEYDFMLDDNVDAKRRGRGENPMSKEYIKRVNNKRVKLGFSPLSNDGYAVDGDQTFDYCKKLITNEIEFKII